ncbi:PTS IIA-like nitrogen-regulatory protein PtsN [Desulfocicer vacuolatum DSM 3385]|uniref:PTS IIA-like nitrogen-regulatory protein PtsN n=1 Tax=Desulfocicer vacuolatum DSM 3385 TaxID=1121400 RepID=A0A1W1ZE93_9BACT|nr:PTS sugar transporter subunit IIA [Desulfocicer vacuolatum]SMC46656.1 PTS IIA-like nitrogen-regulatory protein PtsN [Desulfocicer vacuolatum DSM 3385]
MIQTLEKIAQRLNLSIDTLERWIRQGRIPVSKTGDMGVFHEAELNKWAARQKKIIPACEDPSGGVCHSPEFILVSAMENGGVHHGITGTDRDSVLQAAVCRVPGLSAVQQDELFQQLLAREQLTSTGIGHGMAIPHPRNPLDKGLKTPMVVTCYLDNSVPFNAIDDLPVSTLFLILSPAVACHLSLLSRLSFCLRDSEFISFVKTRPLADALLACIRTKEAQIEKKGV